MNTAQHSPAPHIKVCGMRAPENITSVAELKPDYLGFIFYAASSRYVGDTFRMPALSPQIQKVGVFVNHSIDRVFSLVRQYDLAVMQIHGDESAEYCAALKSPILRGARDIAPHVKTVKAFGISADFDWAILDEYAPHCDYFLFDTKTQAYGGSGQAFDWQLLEQYKLPTPIWISGGIGIENWQELQAFIRHTILPIHTIDLNSRFELEAGLKDLAKLRQVLADETTLI